MCSWYLNIEENFKIIHGGKKILQETNICLKTNQKKMPINKAKYCHSENATT